MFNNLFSTRKNNTSGWFGNYSSWAAVSAVAVGYDADIILNITKEAILKVKNGEAVYERDSVIFEEKHCPYALLAYLQLSAALKKTAIHVMDFGGSLGSTYYQIKEYLTKEVCASWNVIEQAHYVTCGKEFFEDEVLKFYPTIEECRAAKKISLVILSGVIQYLEKPHEFLKQLINHGFDFLIFDRTAFNNKADDRLTLQVVPAEIYPASYPSWFFNQEFFLSHFSQHYKIVAEFPSYVDGEQILNIDNKPAGSDKGFYLINKSFHA
ncbi:TIGR04325 family methyltransferase [Pedobacter sp. JCM 36344]|uniref:TIGR04325 family methyltransferase n=1 Tax=Pedobacter sp. JCM 36344 TaxID=3374280 RepID=UPI00397B9480